MPQALASQTDRHELEQAFEVFNRLSSQLSDSYEQLQQKVEQLTRELSESRSHHIKELRDKERLSNRFYLVLQALPAAVIVIDEKDRIDQFNPAAETFFPEIGWGRLWSEVFTEQITMQSANSEWVLADGRFVSLSESSLSPDSGKIVVIHDVTDTRALQEQLNRQERLTAMGEMAAQLAHQIRTPVSSALLYSGHLGRSDLSDEQRSRFSLSLKNSLEHTASQVTDLLSFARGGHFEPDTINLSNLIGDLEDSFIPQLQQPGRSLTVQDQTDGQALVTGNGDAILGALSNLIDNAFVHGGEQVDVSLLLAPVDDGYCIRIEDNGKGIDLDLTQQIFDPFFTTSSGGTGLGLAVVQNVVLAHGGAIRLIESKSRGAGFVICLPGLYESQNTSNPAGENS